MNPIRIGLMGFSQGSILSMAYALNHPGSIRCVLALSGYLNLDLIREEELAKARSTSFFVSHGTVDQVIPVDWARRSAPVLTQYQIPHQYREYPGIGIIVHR